MTYSVRTLLLAAVVFMASRATPPTVGGQGKGQEGPGLQVSRFVCVHCTQTSQLSIQGLFLSRAAVNQHISHAKACCNAGMGYREMPIQFRAVDFMAGGGGAAGPAPLIRHQEPGNLAENATCDL
jgi:hypothetical protein